ncbi:MAG: DUF1549 domain-containing protein, partial [Verrucomicrobiota bacterium]|nr:DUF1549 domain-containing protein [Verrucomicrobiota bacterium]
MVAFRSLLTMVILTVGSLMAVDFQRDIRPVLASHCFKCHGPDENARKAKLRLDERPDADQLQLLIERIDHTDPEELMPPPAAKKPLNTEQKNILRQWVKDGAEYTEHWAFIAPQSAPLPKVKQTDWMKTDLDRFTLARLENAGLKPSPEADRHRLIRRLSLDLVGLPPTPDEAQAFIKDKRPDA